MVDLNDLKYKRQVLIIKRNKLAQDLKKCERNYETLVEFNKDTARCRDSFDSVNDVKKTTLEEVEELKTDCLTASRYYKGMNKLLNGSGGKLVELAYSKLLQTSKNKLSGYWQKVLDLEEEIEECTKKIEEYDAQIAAIESKLEEDGVVGG